MSLALFNGSYIGNKNTGIGSVAKDLALSFSRDLVRILDPINTGIPESISIPSNLSPENGFYSHLRRLIWLQKTIPRLMKSAKAEFLISPLPEAPLFTGVNSIVIAHDLLPIRYPRINSLLAYNLTYVPLVLSQAKIVLCNSKATAYEIRRLLRVPEKKLVPIRLGFDNKKFYNLNIKRERFFLFLGRHNPHKNLKRALKAFSLIKKEGLKMIFVGPFDSRFTPGLMKYAEEIGVSAYCSWKGWTSDGERLRLLNTCRALVIPSLWEGFGLPALEALACGTPVIASNRGALPEVVGEGAVFVDPLSPTEIAKAMKEVSLNERYLIEAAINGPKQASMFNWDTTAREIETLLTNL